MTNKTFSINIKRVFVESKKVINDRLIRLVGEGCEHLSLTQLMSNIGWKFVVLSLRTHKKVVSRIKLYHKFSAYLVTMTKRHGAEYTVKYLKACNLAISKFVAGQPFKTLREIEPDLPLPGLTRSGLPKIIGTRDRRSLHANSPKIIRLYLNLFSLYRIIQIDGKINTKTITSSYNGNPIFLKIVGNWMEKNSPSVLKRFQDKIEFNQMDQFLMSEKASPSNKKSWIGMVSDISLLKAAPEILHALLEVMKVTCKDDLIELFKDLIKLAPSVTTDHFRYGPLKPSFFGFQGKNGHEFGFVSSIQHNYLNISESTKQLQIGLGQLSTKLEAAGKVRIFAMVDGWTQTACHPLHNYLMDLLKQIPNDGSKDHGTAFYRATEKSKQFGCSYGYDLSAATDRLPVFLQTKIIGSLFGKEFSKNWTHLLVGRPYLLRDGDDNLHLIKYAVGQPMGAKSSWTMLAITHHMIMQYCSYRVYNTERWETRYEIVGDDIVIFDKRLASEYLEVMKLLGVPINISKSITSENKPVVEFVKRLAVKGTEVSALTWKQFLSQNETFLGRLNTVIGILLKEISFRQNPISVFNTILAEALWDTRPHKDVLALIALYVTYSFKAGVPLRHIITTLYSGDPKVTESKLIFGNFDLNRIKSNIKQLVGVGRPANFLRLNRNSLLLTKKIEDIFVRKLQHIKKYVNFRKLDEGHRKIVDLITEGYPTEIKSAIELRLRKWFDLHQDSVKSYPWLSAMSLYPDWDIPVPGKGGAIVKIKEGKATIGLKGLQPLVFNSTWDGSELIDLIFKILKSWEGKISFLSLPDRIEDTQSVTVDKDLSDTAMLQLLVKGIKAVEKHDRKRVYEKRSR